MADLHAIGLSAPVTTIDDRNFRLDLAEDRRLLQRRRRNVRTCSGIQKRRRLRHSRIIRQIYITLALMIEIRAQLAPPPRLPFGNAGRSTKPDRATGGPRCALTAACTFWLRRLTVTTC